MGVVQVAPCMETGRFGLSSSGQGGLVFVHCHMDEVWLLHRASAQEWDVLLAALLTSCSVAAAQAWLGYTPPTLGEDADRAFRRVAAGKSLLFPFYFNVDLWTCSSPLLSICIQAKTEGTCLMYEFWRGVEHGPICFGKRALLALECALS
jgi:hypothetical protein